MIRERLDHLNAYAVIGILCGATPAPVVNSSWVRGVAWLTRLVVNQKIAGSNPVGPANIDEASIIARFVFYSTGF